MAALLPFEEQNLRKKIYKFIFVFVYLFLFQGQNTTFTEEKYKTFYSFFISLHFTLHSTCILIYNLYIHLMICICILFVNEWCFYIHYYTNSYNITFHFQYFEVLKNDPFFSLNFLSSLLWLFLYTRDNKQTSLDIVWNELQLIKRGTWNNKLLYENHALIEKNKTRTTKTTTKTPGLLFIDVFLFRFFFNFFTTLRYVPQTFSSLCINCFIYNKYM